MIIAISQKKKDKRIKENEIHKLCNLILHDLDIECDSELSIHLTDNDEIRVLNRDYRDKDYATDVLSFPQEEPLLGDIVVSLEKIEEQCLEHSVSFEEEFYLMLIHGFLHLIGYDHETTLEDEKEMFQLQDRLLEEFLKG